MVYSGHARDDKMPAASGPRLASVQDGPSMPCSTSRFNPRRATALPKHEYGNPEMKAWSKRLVPKLTHAPGSANLARRIWCDIN